MIQCMYSAKKYVIDTIFKGKAENIKTLNEGKHFIVKAKGVKYYCAYKRLEYLTFGQEYSYVDCDKGESLNDMYIKEALRQDCEAFIFIYPSHAKTILVTTFLRASLDNEWFRVTKNKRSIKKLGGETELISELTYSVPQNMLLQVQT